MTLRKLLTALISVAALTFCFSSTAAASENIQAPLNTESSTNNSDVDNQSSGNNMDVQLGMDQADSQEQAADQTADQTDGQTDGQIDGQAPVLEEGYYIDEQGQVYYDPSSVTIEEPVIEDIPEEDTEDAQEVKDVPEDNSKASSVKEDNTKEQKDTKETVIKKPSYSEEELRLLSCLIYSEAGNQSYQGMLGVANVVINRAKSDVYWHVNTIKEVIYDHKWSVQFSVTIKNSKTGLSALDKALKYYDTGKFPGPNPEAQKKAMNRAIKAAKDALEGKNNIGNYLCFTCKYGSSSIKKKYPDYKIIGDHIFYRTK